MILSNPVVDSQRGTMSCSTILLTYHRKQSTRYGSCGDDNQYYDFEQPTGVSEGGTMPSWTRGGHYSLLTVDQTKE